MASSKVNRRNVLIPEVHSFDYVSRRERRGEAWHQAPFWFMIIAELLTIASGFVGGANGLGFAWSLMAIVIGVLFGTIFVAFHGNQGPHTGLPQMVQSRAQFGRRGLVIPSAMVIFLYVGFTVFDVLLVVPATQVLWPGGSSLAVTSIAVVLTFIIALLGHDFLHLVERWLGYITVIAFGVLTINAAANGIPSSATAVETFLVGPFFLQLSVAAAYALGFAVYVSDYTRYLPATTVPRATITWVYIGNAVGMIWFMGIGALLIGQYPNEDIIPVIIKSANTLFDGYGLLILAISIPGLIMVQAVNVYGAVLTSAGAIDSFRRLRATLTLRVWLLVIVCLVILYISLTASGHFIAAFGDYTIILLYFLTPWTAINLTDYYLVRKGHYAIRDLFAADGGRYGNWQAAGIVAYFIGFIAMIPFFDNSFYVGPIARAFGGADMSFIIGLPVSAAVYWLMSRGIDADAERRVAERQLEQIESKVGESSHG